MSGPGLRRILCSSFIFLIVFLLLVTLPMVFAQEDAVGKSVYDSKCASCHGDDAKGETKAGQLTKTPDITSEPWKQGTSVEELVKTLREGLGKMPKYEDKITAEDLKAVAEYTRKLSKIKE